MGKALRYIIVLLLAGMYFVPKPECLFTMSFPAHLVHHFFHANVFHFTANAVAVWVALDERSSPPKWFMPVAFSIGTIAYCFATTPVIGFSNTIFAAAGLRTPSFGSRWWRSSNTIVFFVTMIAMFFFPMFSATTHLAAYIFGVGLAAIIRFVKGLDYDTRRAAGNK